MLQPIITRIHKSGGAVQPGNLNPIAVQVEKDWATILGRRVIVS
jgi:hypothetical protein